MFLFTQDTIINMVAICFCFGRHTCNLLSPIDEVLVLVQVAIINMVATCLCFTLKIKLGRILK